MVREGPEVVHVDFVIKKGSSVEEAFVTALASPARGHTPLLAVLTPNLPARPPTLSKVLARKDTAKHPFA
ncbi:MULTISPECIES: formaldehyde-activating enzyme [unclassified Methanoculleus]|uniref:formaldehyde-activating enzyme n=1 Tax=unclassified Methanoculleus TaxID=2619537 RepID=UPI0025F01F6A|nr:MULTISPECIES: formaldehyde-activating enzyme [unclassified Methanoculleus]MCK9319187.1 formaldehyde-activating enzyme [Methanoculleus sp.]MDD2255104.1 formaldehyde-activating enzyme [Methanoculleus sp.]MDD2788190.1 formaldehyde-activating enzyme [Methanoculleus sp.]MDD3217389.1 formaldehyde-activating enzyme [Methanoculleus sp.]MDD4315457.1 formaldehyde-activating enzyme [Methanoculleus sp.]